MNNTSILTAELDLDELKSLERLIKHRGALVSAERRDFMQAEDYLLNLISKAKRGIEENS